MTTAKMMFIHALTSLHPGSGTALGTVDLPIQRERHTGWPLIPASSLKGVLRDACRRKAGGAEEKEWLLSAFGPETKEAGDHAGALGFTDARILAFPVRSLKGVFAWVTCPAALERLGRDADLLQTGLPGWQAVPAPAPNEASAPGGKLSPLAVEGGKLILEEFEFALNGSDAQPLASLLAGAVTKDSETRKRIEGHLVVLHDDDFTHFVRNATEVVARIGLDYETKTVKRGALFYQEFLPPETLLYSVLLAEESRRKDFARTAEEMMGQLTPNIPGILQIGGNETIGKGLCALNIV